MSGADGTSTHGETAGFNPGAAEHDCIGGGEFPGKSCFCKAGKYGFRAEPGRSGNGSGANQEFAAKHGGPPERRDFPSGYTISAITRMNFSACTHLSQCKARSNAAQNICYEICFSACICFSIVAKLTRELDLQSSICVSIFRVGSQMISKSDVASVFAVFS